MKCEQVRDLLSSYVDGMTSEKENKIVNTHLKNCSQCQRESEQLRAFCAALKNLPTPEIPERFAQDLRKRLVEENTILFRPKQIKKPRKKGWIAASVAGLALAAGILASTVLPIAPMIASWQEKHNQPGNNKPSVAINEIINRIYSGKEEEKPADVAQLPQENTKPEVNSNADANNPKANNTEEQGPGKNTVESNAGKEVTPKMADVYTTRLNVEKASESLQEVVQLAQTNGWKYEYTNNGSIPQAFSGPNASGLAIKVNEKDVNEVISELGAVGKASAPMHNRLELTQQYSEVEKQISLLQEQKQSLQQAENPDASQLNQIEHQLQEYLKEKSKLDKDLEMVTLNIHFVEEVNP